MEPISPQNPNRLPGNPPLGEPVMGLAPVANANVSPTGIALLGQGVVRWATGIGAFAFALGAIFGGLATQPWATSWAVPGAAVCAAVVLLCNSITGAGPGIRTPPPAAPQSPPSSPPSTPRIGPVP